MEKLQRDLIYFQQELQRETNTDRQILLHQEIKNVQQAILDRVRAQKARVQRENQIMEQILATIDAKAKK